MRDGDGLFCGFLTWWALLGIVTVLGAAQLPSTPGMPELPDRYVQLAAARARRDVVHVPLPSEPAAVPVRKAEGELGTVAARSSTKRGRSVDVWMVGTRGQGRDALVQGIWGDDPSLGDVEAALRDAGSAQAAAGLRGPVGSDGPVGIGDEIGLLGGAHVDVSVDGPLPTRAPPAAAVLPEAGATHQLPAKPLGTIRYCYERRLKEVPDLSGRVELAFVGTQLDVVFDDTGDAPLTDCIRRAARRWDALEGLDRDATYPIVLQRK